MATNGGVLSTIQRKYKRVLHISWSIHTPQKETGGLKAWT